MDEQELPSTSELVPMKYTKRINPISDLQPINFVIYNVLMGLPDKWFNTMELFRDITFMVRNEHMCSTDQLHMLQTVMEKRFTAV